MKNDIINVDIIPSDYTGPKLNSIVKIGGKKYKVLKSEATVNVTLKLLKDGKDFTKS
jgi:hypothetical protein